MTDGDALSFPVDLPKMIRCEAQIQDLLYPQLEWSGGRSRVLGHTAIVFLDPQKVMKLIPDEKTMFFDIDRMKSVIAEIRSTTFWLAPIMFDESLPPGHKFKLPNGSHRTILMSRNGIDSVPYLTCDRMAQPLIDDFGAGKVNPIFDLSGMDYPVSY